MSASHHQLVQTSACIARAAGRGRVAVWGDSTVFSVFEPGKLEVVAGTLDY
ncbi:MAG: hypothetical protein GY711_25400 [bacterium]|nr:hypothetical protein [bacterium]